MNLYLDTYPRYLGIDDILLTTADSSETAVLELRLHRLTQLSIQGTSR